MEVPPAAVDEEVSETETEEESEDEALLTADERRRCLREREVDRIVFGNPHRAPNELLMEVISHSLSCGRYSHEWSSWRTHYMIYLVDYSWLFSMYCTLFVLCDSSWIA